MNFYFQIKNSIYSPIFYQKDLIDLNFYDSLKYFFKLIILISIILVIVLSIDFIPKIIFFLNNLTINISKYYPDELEINIKNGETITNVPTPYFLIFPEELNYENKKFDNFLVIDTINNFSIEKFKEYNTLILLAKKNIVYDNDGKIVVEDLSRFPDAVINKKIINDFSNKIIIKKIFVPLIILLFFIFTLIFYIFKLFYLLFGALLIILILKILKYKINYKKSYQIGLHSITLPILFFFILKVFNLNIDLPFVFTILMLFIVFINFIKKEQSIFVNQINQIENQNE